MKKLLLIGVLAGALGSFAYADLDDMFEDFDKMPRHMKKMHRKRSVEEEKLRIMFEEKKLEIRKELLNGKPDWNKIEKINIDLATEVAKRRTAMIKAGYEKGIPLDEIDDDLDD